MSFEFATATRILFGEGRVREVGEIVAALGRRALVVQGRGGRAGLVIDLLKQAAVSISELRVAGEPEVALVEAAVEQARVEQCEVIVAVGGGSVIDAGKAIAALLTNPGEVRRYLEVVGEGRPLERAAAPFVALPTTAGTGAEVSRNSVLAVPGERVKVSLRSPLMLPTVALIDPELTYSLPPAVTASTGMDALTQCVEPFITPQANPLTDGIAHEGMRRAAVFLHRAYQDGGDREARREMATASLCGGLALANAKLGAVHGIAGPLGGMYPVPHGVACARLLAPVMQANVRALRARASGSLALARYEDVARILTGRAGARAEEGAEWVSTLVEELRVPRLAEYGVDADAAPAVVPMAMRASSMRGNPIGLTAEELTTVLITAAS